MKRRGGCAHGLQQMIFWHSIIPCSESGTELKNCLNMCPYVSLWVSENELVIKSVSEQQMTAASGVQEEPALQFRLRLRPPCGHRPFVGVPP